MSEEQLTDTITGEYERRYPNWKHPVTVTKIISNVFGGQFAVVRAKIPEDNEELCFIDLDKGVRIFSTTEELAEFIAQKASATWLEELRRKLNIAIAVIGLALFVVLPVAFWGRFQSAVPADDLATIVGIPFSFVAAFVVVALFKQAEAPMDFQGFGLKMKGAAGEIILWLLCFVAISGAIAVLWKA
jgi:hypothetical protein